jgi:hypothetical protein
MASSNHLAAAGRSTLLSTLASSLLGRISLALTL